MVEFNVGAGRFSADELERSARFDPLRRLRGDAGSAVLAEVWILLEPRLARPRGWSPADKDRYMQTLDTLLANLAAAAFNRIDSQRFVAVSFNTKSYIGLQISPAAMRRLRDGLLSLRLIEGRAGYRRPAPDGGVAHARRTRLRATPSLRALFRSACLNRVHVGWSRHRDLINMKSPDADLLPEPPEIQISRAVLEALNTRIAAIDLHLPDEAWLRIAARYGRAPEGPFEKDRPLAGDLTSLSLYRGFKGGWDRGGRLYGGWWINVPRVERANLMIMGSLAVELDYARLHPTLLYARLGRRLDFDPYVIPGLEGPDTRELGKRTFNRLLNRTPPAGRQDVRLRPMLEDLVQLPKSWSFERYLARFMDRLEPIATWFGTGEGLRLQREDSDLAIEVLTRLLNRDIVALPVHDSFIVRTEDGMALRRAMNEAFSSRYGFEPVIR